MGKALSKKFFGYWDKKQQKFVEVPEEWRNHKPQTPPQVFIKAGFTEPLRHPANGKHYTSERRYDQVSKMYNLVELGDAPLELKKPMHNPSDDELVRDIKTAYAQLEHGTAEITAEEKEVCKRIDQNYKNKMGKK